MLRCSLALLALAFTGPLASSVCGAQLLASQELLSGDIETLDEYGYSVAVDGEWIAVGAISDDRNSQVDRGSVSLFRRAGTT
ncbi:MAG: FG-GAP repeat protein, partial [Planctomycetota bacterium]